MNILILILVELIVALSVCLWYAWRKIKKMSDAMTKASDGIDKVINTLNRSIQSTEPLVAPDKVDAEELEVDEDTYNKTIKEWIYGAEEKEGGIDV